MSNATPSGLVLLLVAIGLFGSPSLGAQDGFEELPRWRVPQGSGVSKVLLTDLDCRFEIRLQIVLGAQSALLASAQARDDYAKLLAHNLHGQRCPEAQAALITMRAESGASVGEYAIRLAPEPPRTESTPRAEPRDSTSTSAAVGRNDAPEPGNGASIPARGPSGTTRDARPTTAATAPPEPPADTHSQGFGPPFWIELAFAGLLGLMVLGIHVVAASPIADAFLEMPSSIRKILSAVLRGTALLTPRGGQSADRMIIVGGDDLVTRFTVPVTRGIFWHENRLQPCGLAYVPVPPGMIAWLNAKQVSQSRILDTSRAVTILDNPRDGRLSVIALERGARWQITSPRGIDTHDGYAVRLHLAVHSWIDTSADARCVARLFEEQAAYPNKLRDWALGTLGELLGNRSYDEALRFGDILIDELNQRWQASAQRLLGAEVCEALSTEFTAILIKPRQEGEKTRFAPIFSHVAAVEDRIKQLENKSEYLIRELGQELGNHYSNMTTSLAALFDPQARRIDARMLQKSESQFRRNLRENTEAIGGSLSKGMDRSVVGELVKKPFELGKSLLESNAANYIDACTKLAAAVRRLRVEQQRTMTVIDAPAPAESGPNRQQDIPT
jgi:hypothetical protein